MGGEKSGIASDTADVFLEAAFFQPDTVAGVARRFGFATDAAQRFERGVDPRGQERAVERATQSAGTDRRRSSGAHNRDAG
jgi:phenylalanyl-tRNA synthetase beta chain